MKKDKPKSIIKNIISIISNKYHLKLFSILIATIIWLIVVWSIDPNTIRVINNVPIKIDISESSMINKLGLSVIDGNNNLGNVYVKGKRNLIGMLNSKDIEASVIVSNISGPGTYELNVSAYSNNRQFKDMEIYAINPETIKIKLDKVITKTIPVEVMSLGATVHEGYMLNTPIPSINSLSIVGPERDLKNIKKGIITCKVNKELTKTSQVRGNVSLVNENNITVNTDYININNEFIDVVIPVLKKKTLPVTIDFINIPTGFPIDELKYSLSDSTIDVAGPAEDIDAKESINLAYIDMKKLEMNEEIEFDVNLPSDFINIENIQKIYVHFDMKDLDSKYMSNIKVKMPYKLSNVDVILNTKFINNVKIIGIKDVVNTLTAGDIIAEIASDNTELPIGRTTLPVNIYVPNKGKIWAVGEYKAEVTIKEKK